MGKKYIIDVYDNSFIELKDKIIDFVCDKNYVPMKSRDIFDNIKINKCKIEFFNSAIKYLIDNYYISKSKKNKILPIEAHGYIRGTFLANPKGFGFVYSENSNINVFIKQINTSYAFDKDIVLCEIIGETSKKPEGKIVKIIERGQKKVVGTFEQCDGFGFVSVDDKNYNSDVFISKNNINGAVNGHRVVVEIVKFPKSKLSREGKIVEILGHVNDVGVDVLSIVKQYDLPTNFDASVYKYVENIDFSISDSEISKRKDFRNINTITIDGEDSKDLDDAISLEINENGNYNLFVHIADVSHYVKEKSILDNEAYKRGTSVYLVDRVIPMIPHRLSNGICSLNPNEDRLTLTCVMEIDKKGDVISYDIFESIIKSKYRMTYTQVNNIIENNCNDITKNNCNYDIDCGTIDMIMSMNNLRLILNKKRFKRGYIDFDTNEAKILVDEKGFPVEIKRYQRNNATNLIEEFMLVCNETIAQHYFWQEIPFIFRNHDIPSGEKLERLDEFLKNFGYHIKYNKKGKFSPKAIQKILVDTKNEMECAIISKVVLRSMQQAKYMAENRGHFGLATKYYCHFTSPIRRYPDLEIHRIIKEHINKGISKKRYKYFEKVLPNIAQECSKRERIAEEVERETNKLKMVEFMEDKIGNTYRGIISGISSWGIYVELENTIEGMISLNSINEKCTFDEKNIMIICDSSKKTYLLGQSVIIDVFSVDKKNKNIDFVFSKNVDVLDVM